MEPLRSKTLIVFNGEHQMTTEILEFLKTLNMDPVISKNSKHSDKSILEKHTQWHQIVNKAIIILNPSVWDYGMDKKPGDAHTRAHQSIVFELGFWLGKFGRDRIVAIFYDQKSFRIPCNYFDCQMISWKKKSLWKKELQEFLDK